MNAIGSNFPRSAAVLVVLLALSACGGGGGGSVPAPTPPPTPAPAPGPTVSRGMITAQGTVLVNGVEYTTTGTTTVLVDGNPGTLADLTAGRVVKVRGTSDDQSKKGTAAQIEIRDAVQGPIDSVDSLNKTLTVLGQVVHLEDNVTHLNDDTFKVFDDAGYLPGDVVEVHGFADSATGLRATRVDRIASGPLELKGFVSSLGGATFSLSLTKGGAEVLTVNFLAGTLPTGVVNGARVQVQALAPPVAGAITATTVKLEDPLGVLGEKVAVEGYVANGVLADFVLDGQEVTTNAATLFEGGVDSDFDVGVRLEAEGTVDASGAIVATRIRFVSDIKIEGDVTSFVGGLDVLGLTVGLDAFTRIDTPIDLTLNKHVLVSSVLDRNGALKATRVVVLPLSSKASYQGPVSAADATAGTLTILGRTFSSNSATQWRASSTASEVATTKAAFFAQVIPKATVVKVRWNHFGLITDPATEAEIQLGH